MQVNRAKLYFTNPLKLEVVPVPIPLCFFDTKLDHYIIENNVKARTLVDSGYIKLAYEEAKQQKEGTTSYQILVYVLMSDLKPQTKKPFQNFDLLMNANQENAINEFFSTEITLYGFYPEQRSLTNCYAPRSVQLFDQNDEMKCDLIQELLHSNVGDNGIDITFKRDDYRIKGKEGLEITLPISDKCDYIHQPFLFLLRSRFVKLGLRLASGGAVYDNKLLIINETDKEIALGNRFIQIHPLFILSQDIEFLMRKFIGDSFINTRVRGGAKKEKDCDLPDGFFHYAEKDETTHFTEYY